jgi:hypothetical protein
MNAFATMSQVLAGMGVLLLLQSMAYGACLGSVVGNLVYNRRGAEIGASVFAVAYAVMVVADRWP